MKTSVRYQIIEEIGRGAMGIVYRGKDPKINRDVALKCLRPHILEAHESAGRRFQQEILALGRLIHPNIVTIFDVWEDPASDSTYIVMEYVPGTSLAQLIKENFRFTLEQVVHIGAEICKGLDFAHSKEVVHRDIKPGNILLSEDLRVVQITDFGIARLDSIGLTQSDHLAGTPQYMSPEQCRGEMLDGRSDLFAVGALLYEMLTHQKAFAGDSVTGIMHQILTHTPYPPYLISDASPEALSAVVMQALEKEASHRFSSGLEMADALLVAIEGTSGLGETFLSTDSITKEIEKEAGPAETQSAPAPSPEMDLPETPDSLEARETQSRPFWIRTALVLFSLAAVLTAGALYLLRSPPVPPSAPIPISPKTPPTSSPITKNPKTTKHPPAAPTEKPARPEPARKKTEDTVAPEKEPRVVEPTAPSAPEPPSVLFGHVIFATTPDGADISINGIHQGTSPVALDLPSGSHELVVSKKGYHALEATIDVPSGEKIPVNLKL
ncbi:MAG: protein kinase, partial [Nitrospiria bacterium]